jgi:ubiquitin-conjugating enzyme E2 S
MPHATAFCGRQRTNAATQTSKSMRRLATDHASLHQAGLPPNYLFAPSKEDSFADLTSLSILLAGPEGTPFVAGVFQLELNIPTTYPQSPPTAHFKTKIFHPNVDPTTGAVCVDTLKRDWKPELTLRDVLVTISCLLVCPNPASALNAEAGQLMEEDFREYERKANLWAKMHAAVPPHMKSIVEEARTREEVEKGKQKAGKGKRRKDDDIRVLVQEIEEENRDAQYSNNTNTQPPSVTPDVGGVSSAEQNAHGLGLEMGVDSSVVMDTPTQQPPRRRKKIYNLALPTQPEGSHRSSAPSFSTVLSTPTPQRMELSQTSSTDAIKPPDAKRPRVSPSATTPVHQRYSQDFSDVPRWLNWIEASPTSPEENKVAKQKRETSEYRRLKAAGFCIKRYNSGRFGPRKGIERL